MREVKAYNGTDETLARLIRNANHNKWTTFGVNQVPIALAIVLEENAWKDDENNITVPSSQYGHFIAEMARFGNHSAMLQTLRPYVPTIPESKPRGTTTKTIDVDSLKKSIVE